METKIYTFNAFSTAKGSDNLPTTCDVVIGKGFAGKIMLTARYVRDNELLNAAQFVHAIWRDERGDVVSTDYDQVLVYENNFVLKAVTRNGNLAITSVSCKVDQLAMDFGLRIVPVPETTVEDRNRVHEGMEEDPNAVRLVMNCQ